MTMENKNVQIREVVHRNLIKYMLIEIVINHYESLDQQLLSALNYLRHVKIIHDNKEFKFWDDENDLCYEFVHVLEHKNKQECVSLLLKYLKELSQHDFTITSQNLKKINKNHVPYFYLGNGKLKNNLFVEICDFIKNMKYKHFDMTCFPSKYKKYIGHESGEDFTCTKTEIADDYNNKNVLLVGNGNNKFNIFMSTCNPKYVKRIKFKFA